MVNQSEKERIRVLLSEAVTVLCKNALAFQLEFTIEGLLGVTLDKEEIFLVNIKENVRKDNDSNSHIRDSNSEYSDQGDLSFTSTLEGVTGEFVQVGRSSDNTAPSNKSTGGRSKGKSTNASNHGSAKSRQQKTTMKFEQTDVRHNGDGSAVATTQATILAGDLVLGNSPWDQGLATNAMSMTQAVAASAPIVAASMSQMTGISQPTQEWFMRESMRLSAQLEGQRRRSRDHMRRYRQQLRSGNNNEYEDRKRRQREGMRRYRERLRIENPEKYAEMNRKHAEQERKRRMRVRSFSASFAQQPSAQQSLQEPMQTGENHVVVPKQGTDFLHMAMENSQLLPVRDMHQLIQTSFPLASGALGLTAGALSVAPSMVSIPAGSVALAAGPGSGLTPVTVEEVVASQHQASVNSHAQQIIVSGGTAVARIQNAGGGNLHSGAATPTLHTQSLPVQEAQVLTTSSVSSAAVSTLSSSEHDYSHNPTHVHQNLPHVSQSLKAEPSTSDSGVGLTVVSSSH